MRVQLWKQEIWSSLIFLLPWLSPRVRALLAVREFWRFAKSLMKETDCSKSWFSQINSRFLIFGTATSVQFSSVAQLCPTVCDPMNHSTPGLPVHHQLLKFTQTHVHRVSAANPAISSSVVPFSSCPQSLPASGSSPMSQLFTRGAQSIGVSASATVFLMNTQDWSPLGWTGWISLQSKGLSRVFSNTTAQKHQFFGAQLSSQSNFTSIHDHWKNSLD